MWENEGLRDSKKLSQNCSDFKWWVQKFRQGIDHVVMSSSLLYDENLTELLLCKYFTNCNGSLCYCCLSPPLAKRGLKAWNYAHSYIQNERHIKTNVNVHMSITRVSRISLIFVCIFSFRFGFGLCWYEDAACRTAWAKWNRRPEICV